MYTTVDYRPEVDVQINEMQVRLSNWPRDEQPYREKYSIMADSTNLRNQTDFMWTNQR